MGIIFYGTHYGSAKRYAEELGRRTGFLVYNVKDIRNVSGLKDQVQVVHIGSLYAGSVVGLKEVLAAELHPSVRFTLVTVGLADPENPANSQNLMRQLEKYQRLETLDAQIFGLRGAYNHREVSFVHRIMMGMMLRVMRNKAKKVPSEEVEAFLELQHTPVDAVDFDALKPIVQALT